MLCVIGGHGMMYGYGFGAGLMGFMMLAWILLIIAVVYFVYKKFGSGKSTNEALDLLKLKFVKGEITEEEYLNKKNILLKK